MWLSTRLVTPLIVVFGFTQPKIIFNTERQVRILVIISNFHGFGVVFLTNHARRLCFQSKKQQQTLDGETAPLSDCLYNFYNFYSLAV